MDFPESRRGGNKVSMKFLIVGDGRYMSARAITDLIKRGHEIAEIWTTAPKSFERHPSFVKRLLLPAGYDACTVIERYGISVRNISGVKKNELGALFDQSSPADALLCTGSHVIFPLELLDRFPDRAFNLHPAMLPDYRGPGPIESLVLHGKADEFGGITLHRLSEGIDEGDIVGQRRLPFTDYGTRLSWSLAFARASGDLVENELDALLRGVGASIPQQPGSGSYVAAKDIELSVRQDWTFDRAVDHMRKAPLVQYRTFLTLNDDGKHIAIIGTPRPVGPPTGEPGVIGRWFVVVDLADRRIRFFRENRGARLLRRLQFHVDFAAFRWRLMSHPE
ncbi:formyltransferase family protein [Hoeflea sp. CAU 1731]